MIPALIIKYFGPIKNHFSNACLKLTGTSSTWMRQWNYKTMKKFQTFRAKKYIKQRSLLSYKKYYKNIL